ncbi:peptide chain release factor N(5)-glutamine methyltransferase [Bordetella genomosp. 9]|uniref:Release factor glutamine methyltransferase n=1 Tax=Bordetella genomosp. 9 TaxID=1416803 RepID=A0A1W6Z677_9BORD|nr:peptide chain release factor N(5)-glutamine methyltransferase [Bordetella genomosp. 9]ARP88838.1 protein-(glutamine-N5) methyltransferase, release factor-specific [Bordetella genomosp. 9]ARP92852.1 protein-(glutamine-N5) methyltransferase, release factor-specific [Bordetella genomosp. 9]
MLLEHVLEKPRAWILAHDTDPLPSEAVRAFTVLAARRAAGEPMAYLVGQREFMGHMFKVTPDVLIPRPETELLVQAALEWLQGFESVSVLDLGTGSGAIAISIALARPDVAVLATDRSVKALKVAAENAVRLGAHLHFAAGDWYEALTAEQKFDVIVSNPPYISREDPHLEKGDLRFEPRLALTDDADGLDALRVIIGGARAHLKPGGVLWVEHGWDQAEAVRRLLAEAGLRGVDSRRDLAGIERISGGYL